MLANLCYLGAALSAYRNPDDWRTPLALAAAGVVFDLVDTAHGIERELSMANQLAAFVHQRDAQLARKPPCKCLEHKHAPAPAPGTFGGAAAAASPPAPAKEGA